MTVVIPAKNEGPRISRVLETVESLNPELIIPVINGSTDSTLIKVIIHSKKSDTPIQTLYSKSALGLDIPRAFGAAAAFRQGADYVLFIDGDMDGRITGSLKELVRHTVHAKLDMGLTDCYAGQKPANPLAELITFFRRKLNLKIGLADSLGDASPSHGPHMISRKLMESVPLKELAVPPVSLAVAAGKGLKIDIGAKLSPAALGRQRRNDFHSRMIAKLIIGDCIEAMNAFDKRPRTRQYNSRDYLGYHCQRNFQLLSEFLDRELAKKNPTLF